MVWIVFGYILGLDERNNFGKTNNKDYMRLEIPENERNLQDGNFRTIPKTLNSHKVRLNWSMKLKFSGNTSLIETK